MAPPKPEEAATPIAPPTPVSVTPIHVPAPAPIDMSASLQQAGLVMIETSSDKPPVAPPEQPSSPLGRKPRAVEVVASEPLQMVETKHD